MDSSTTLNREETLPSNSVISCKVCGSLINLDTKKDQHVVKCENCNEATPIRDPPPGQKYIRCPCKCLLICKSTAQRISCPRPSCRKIIVLQSSNFQNSPQTNDYSPVPGMCCCNCGHCGETFLFNSLVNQLARCPHCERKSSVGKFAKARGGIFFVLSITIFVIAIILTIVTKYRGGQIWWIVSCVLFYLIGVFLAAKSVYFLTMKNSIIVESQP